MTKTLKMCYIRLPVNFNSIHISKHILEYFVIKKQNST